jgi:hypothetical protein
MERQPANRILPNGTIRFTQRFKKIDFIIVLLYYYAKLTPRSRIIPEKQNNPELVKKFLAFYGTRRFITAFTRARHQS